MPESHRRKCPDWFRGKHSCHTSEPATAAQLPADGACSARLSRPRVRTQNTTEPAAPRNGYSGVAAVRTRRATLMYPLSAHDYNVVMAHPVSIRFRDPGVSERLKAAAAVEGRSTSELAEELIDEGLRLRRHPLIIFRDGPAGRRAALTVGRDVWEVIGGLLHGDVPMADRVDRAVAEFGLRPQLVEAALAYYAEFTQEVDSWIAANNNEADELEGRWRRQLNLLAS